LFSVVISGGTESGNRFQKVRARAGHHSDKRAGDVLMVGFMNSEAFAQTQSTAKWCSSAAPEQAMEEG